MFFSTLAASSFGNEAIPDRSAAAFASALLTYRCRSLRCRCCLLSCHQPQHHHFLSPSLQPALRRATSAAANSPAEPVARDTGMIFIASSAACAASAGNFAAAAAAADAADTVISAAACTDTAPASVTAACCANNSPYAATIAAKNTRLSRSQFPAT